MKVIFRTLGCKVNQYETQLLKEQFFSAGFETAPGDHSADIYVINTCTVTARSDAESRRLIRNALKENPAAKIIVTGCYAELDKKEIRSISDKLLVVKNSDKNKILKLIGRPLKTEQPSAITGFEGRTKAFIKVQDGCDNFCSYCKVPLVRGRSRSREADDVVAEIKKVVSGGYKEVILTGICLGDWGRDIGRKLSRLLDEIERSVEGEFRIRLSSIEPWYVTPDLIDKIASSDKICKHLHIPMQSGDDEILKDMNRHFRATDFIGLIEKLRSLIPEVAFTTDILVGFPGETEEHFNNTLRVAGLTRPSRSHIFPFSMRNGTKVASSGIDPVPNQIVRDRIKRLKVLTDRFADEYKAGFLGKSVKVLVETQRDKKTGLLTGFTDTYLKVVFNGNDELRGTLRTVGFLDKPKFI